MAALDWARQTQLAQNESFSAAIFLGDGADDLPLASAQADFTIPWYKVRGNLDMDVSIPKFLVIEVSGRKLFLAHGNLHNVNEENRTIAIAAKSAGAEAALFGHTHAPYCSQSDGIFLLNPGSIGRSRSDAGPTFAVLVCPDSGSFQVRFFRLERKKEKIDVEEMQV